MFIIIYWVYYREYTKVWIEGYREPAAAEGVHCRFKELVLVLVAFCAIVRHSKYAPHGLLYKFLMQVFV